MPADRQPSSPSDPVEDGLGLKPRLAALALLEAALGRRNGLEEATSAKGFLELPPRDRAFARALTMATLRHLGPIDRLLAERLQKPPPEAVSQLLRIGVTQILYLEIADFAAVATTVQIAAARPATKPFKGLVNAVLRGLSREPPAPPPAEAYAPHGSTPGGRRPMARRRRRLLRPSRRSRPPISPCGVPIKPAR